MLMANSTSPRPGAGLMPRARRYRAPKSLQIPMESTQWADGKFTQDDYKTLVKAMFDGTLTVSNDITKAAKDFATVITVDDQGNIK